MFKLLPCGRNNNPYYGKMPAAYGWLGIKRYELRNLGIEGFKGEYLIPLQYKEHNL